MIITKIFQDTEIKFYLISNFILVEKETRSQCSSSYKFRKITPLRVNKTDLNRSKRMPTGNQMALQSRRFSNANIIEMRKHGKHPKAVNDHPIRNVRRQAAPRYLPPHGNTAFMIYRL